MAQKSLTRGLDFGDDKKKPESKAAKKESSLPAGKVAFVGFAFVVAGLGIAYSMGLFESAPKTTPTVAPPPPEVQAVQEKARKEQERLLSLPEGHPQRPVISGS